MKPLHYPTKCWKKESSEHNINVEIIHTLNNMIEKDFSHLKSVLIVKKGSIIYEKYLNSYSQDTLYETACMSKSFLSAVIGTAIQKNLIKYLFKKTKSLQIQSIPDVPVPKLTCSNQHFICK